jgi:glycosyltransferase involved in cell wall biosynthesis
MHFLLANNHCITDPTAGSAQSLRLIMRYLADAGHSCQILTTARMGSPTLTIEDHLNHIGVAVPVADGPAAVKYTADGIPVTLLLTRHNDPAKPDIAESVEYHRLFEEILSEFAPDQLIATDGHAFILRALATARERGLTTVFTLRNYGYYDPRYFESVDHVFTTCQAVTDRHREKIGLISTPIDSPMDWARIIAPVEARDFVTFVNPSFHKGVMLFARLADMLGARRPDIPVLVVQSGRSAGVVNSIPGLDFTRYPQIMAAPPVANPADFFALTRLLVVPSLSESFGRVAAEAMINGIPPIVSNRGGLPATVGGDFSAGGGGLVVPVPDWLTSDSRNLPSEEEARPWFDAVCTLWDDASFYEAVSTRARQLAEERYSEGVSRAKHVGYLTSLKTGGRVFE